MKRHDKFYVYIIEDKNGTYDTGFTNDLEKRYKLHENGFGAKYLKGRKPIKLAFFKEYQYYKSTLAAERKIKSYTRERKQELINIFSQNKTDDKKIQ